jgi:hypothetical protein
VILPLIDVDRRLAALRTAVGFSYTTRISAERGHKQQRTAAKRPAANYVWRTVLSIDACPSKSWISGCRFSRWPARSPSRAAVCGGGVKSEPGRPGYRATIRAIMSDDSRHFIAVERVDTAI